MSGGNDELVKEMSATRKALALYFRKLAAFEEKIDSLLRGRNRPKPEVAIGK